MRIITAKTATGRRVAFDMADVVSIIELDDGSLQITTKYETQFTLPPPKNIEQLREYEWDYECLVGTWMSLVEPGFENMAEEGSFVMTDGERGGGEVN